MPGPCHACFISTEWEFAGPDCPSEASLATVAEAVTKGTTTEDMFDGCAGVQRMMVCSPRGRPAAEQGLTKRAANGDGIGA